MSKFTEAQIEAASEAVASALGDAYDCTRVWSAWSYGTMGSDDFSMVAEDSGRVHEITMAALEAVGDDPVKVELLAALKDALSSMEDMQEEIDGLISHCGGTGGFGEHLKDIEAIRSKLKKAEGDHG